MTQIGDILKSLRNREQLTQNDLAKKVGISRSRINNYENYIREPDLETAIIFADFYKVSMDALIGRRFQSEQLTQEEQNFLDLFRNATADGRYEAYYALKSNQKRTADQESLSNLA